MALSANVYLQLVDSLRSEPRRGKEQRAGGRAGVGGQLAIQVINDRMTVTSEITGWVRNLSVDGIGMTSAGRLLVGSRFLIALQQSSGKSELLLVCEVRYCKKLADRVYSIGGRFVSDNAAD